MDLTRHEDDRLLNKDLRVAAIGTSIGKGRVGDRRMPQGQPQLGEGEGGRWVERLVAATLEFCVVCRQPFSMVL